MAEMKFELYATEAEKDILRKRRSEIYSFFANERDKQEPGKATELYAELTKIQAALGESNPNADDNNWQPSVGGDAVVHPSHYTSGGIECIDAMKAMLTGYEQEKIHTKFYWHFLAGQVLKYLWRWPLKERPLQDLKKARWYLDRLIADVESQDHAVTELHSDMGKEICE